MTVYFAQTRIDPTKVKIGFTKDVEARRVNMSVSVPGGIHILATLPGGKEAEGYLHEKFESYNVGGEWFHFSDEIRDFVRDVQNGKQGLIPFRDQAAYMVRSTSEYAADALELASQMAEAILNHEFRGIGDTIDAAIFRVERRHHISGQVIKRLRYRKKKDVWAGEYLHLKAIYEQIAARSASSSSVVNLRLAVNSSAPELRDEIGEGE